MKKISSINLIVVLFFLTNAVAAQTSYANFNFEDFDKIQIENINGRVEIELGGAFSISITDDQMQTKQINVSKAEGKLLIQLDKKYMNNWKEVKTVLIKISMPEISMLINSSNADIFINNFAGRYFDLQNSGNGDVNLAGTRIDFLKIKNDGNGNIDTKSINAEKVVINKSGNGNISIRSNNEFNVQMVGNGDIINSGSGRAIIGKQSGNGKVVYKN